MILTIDSAEPFRAWVEQLTHDARYYDPHFLYDPNNLWRAIEKKQQAFVCFEGGEIAGLFVWKLLPEARYAELIIGFARTQSPFEEMLSCMEQAHPGFQFDFVINPNHLPLRRALQKRGALFDPVQTRLIWPGGTVSFSEQESLQVCPYAPSWKREYLSIHEQEVYWTGERILEATDRFRVFLAIQAGRVIGYLDVTYGQLVDEPYSLFVLPHFQKQGYEEALLRLAIDTLQPDRMMVLVDKEAREALTHYERVGFFRPAGQDSQYATFLADYSESR